MDAGGDSATKRGIDLAQAQGFNVKVITMPEGKDPADVISQNPQDWEEAVKSVKSILEFYFETTFSRFSSGTADGKREISKILLPVIKRIPNKIEQSHWLQELSKKISVREDVITEELKKINITNLPNDFIIENMESKVPVSIKTRKELLEESIASLAIKSPKDTLCLIGDDCLSLFEPKIQTVLADLKNQTLPKDQEFFNYLSLKAEVEEGEIDCEKEIKTCLKEISNLDTRKQLDGLSQDIKKAENEKDLDRVSSLIQKFKELTGKLINI